MNTRTMILLAVLGIFLISTLIPLRPGEFLDRRKASAAFLCPALGLLSFCFLSLGFGLPHSAAVFLSAVGPLLFYGVFPFTGWKFWEAEILPRTRIGAHLLGLYFWPWLIRVDLPPIALPVLRVAVTIHLVIFFFTVLFTRQIGTKISRTYHLVSGALPYLLVLGTWPAFAAFVAVAATQLFLLWLSWFARDMR
jgi:hypothetical protein